MNILVLGENGQLGRCLAEQLMETSFDTVFTSRAEIEITDFFPLVSKSLR
jgi:dTDP-4-dehydrorhamnose reductase